MQVPPLPCFVFPSLALWLVRRECGRPSAPGFRMALYPLLPVVGVTYFGLFFI